MMVTVSGRSGLTKAYRSVLSASGSWLMSGASRWLEARAVGSERGTSMAAIAARAKVRTRFIEPPFVDAVRYVSDIPYEGTAGRGLVGDPYRPRSSPGRDPP